VGRVSVQTIRPRVVPGRDEWFLAPFIARTGVAVFGISLLVPMLASGMVAHPSPPVIVVAAVNEQVATDYELPRLPEPVARSRVVAPTPEASTALDAASGNVVTASWYGPGFYENRLPCWPWLAANGLPIQFLPDTWGVAHKSLPCGTMVTLSHGANTVTVPVVDRGPYIAGREFDLSPRVKAELGCTDLCTVVMQIR
jgi:hypothetical protein